MDDDSGEAKPADGAPPSTPAAPTPPAAAVVDAPLSEPATPLVEPTATPEAPPSETPTVSVEPPPSREPALIEAAPPLAEPLAESPVAVEAAPAAVEVTPLPPAAPTEPVEQGAVQPPTAEPSVDDPLPFTGEGDRRKAVEGGATAAVIESSIEPPPAPAADAPVAEPVPAVNEAAPIPDRVAALAAAPVAIAAATAAPTPAPPPIPRAPRTIPPIIEFAAWRLLELAATVTVASALIGFLIRADTPADPSILADRLGVTVPLVILALLIGAIVGLPIGYLSARIGSWLDVALRALTTIGLSLNPVWLSMLLVLVLALTLQWLQPGGFIPWTNPAGALLSLVLPALALGLPLAAEIASRMRDALAAILAGPAMRTADTLGYSRAEAIRDFALRQALARTFGRLAVPLALLVPLSLVIEAVFYLPGLGRMIFTALSERDFATLQLGLVTLVALVALCRFLGHLLEASVDPRLARRA